MKFDELLPPQGQQLAAGGDPREEEGEHGAGAEGKSRDKFLVGTTLPTSVSAAWPLLRVSPLELGAHVHQCAGSMLSRRPACRWLCVVEAAPKHAFLPCMFGKWDSWETHALSLER